jgi:hypothetical protein
MSLHSSGRSDERAMLGMERIMWALLLTPTCFGEEAALAA